MNKWKEKEKQYQNSLSSIDLIHKTWKKARNELSKQWKLWSFYTPEETIVYLVDNAFQQFTNIYKNNKQFNPKDIKILEPSVGLWSFIPVVVEKLLLLYENHYNKDKDVSNLSDIERKIFFLESIFKNNIYMCDIDVNVVPLLKERLNDLFKYYTWQDPLNINYNIIIWNFLENNFDNFKFDIIIWNPPYWVDVNSKMKKDLTKRTLSGIDKKFDKRYWLKIKKESYSYFIVHSIELLKDHWILSFITSDTFLTLWTFKWLRNFILNEWRVIKVDLSPKNLFAPFTTYPTASILFINEKKEDIEENNKIRLTKIGNKESYINWNNITEKIISVDDIYKFNHLPFYFYAFDFIDEFSWKKKLWDIIKTAWWLTTWNNKLFIEKYEPNKHKKLIWKKYAYYNKSLPWVKWFSDPKYVIKWTNNGEEIRNYKKECGKWYLKWMGGEKHYFKEWLQINLIWSKINARYTPKWMYVFDAGSPMIVLKKNKTEQEDTNELLFILAYLNSNKASKLLKNVINHTRNIQPKNIEALPYPKITKDKKEEIIKLVKEIIDNHDNKDIIENNYMLINNYFD